MGRWLIPILAAVAAIVIVVLLVHDPGRPLERWLNPSAPDAFDSNDSGRNDDVARAAGSDLR